MMHNFYLAKSSNCVSFLPPNWTAVIAEVKEVCNFRNKDERAKGTLTYLLTSAGCLHLGNIPLGMEKSWPTALRGYALSQLRRQLRGDIIPLLEKVLDENILTLEVRGYIGSALKEYKGEFHK